MFNYLYRSKGKAKDRSNETVTGSGSVIVQNQPGEGASETVVQSSSVNNLFPEESPPASASPILVDENDAEIETTEIDTSHNDAESNQSIDQVEIDEIERKYETPAQAKLIKELSEIDTKLVALNTARNLGIGDDNVASFTKQINQWTEKRKAVSNQLKIKKTNQIASKKKRDKQKRKIAQAIVDFPALANTVKIRDSAGRPPVEDVYPNLHADILKIASIGAAASDRRRDDLLRTVKTLDQLHSALSDLGYKLGRQTTYLCLLPKSASSSEGKKHVRTVPVR